jgi:catechol 2,3-dioxygenase-like lactoylglutathione lyase family enzyme
MASSVESSEPRVKVERVNQVAIVVEDAEKAMDFCWNAFGIGPWSIYTFEFPFVSYYEYRGRPAQARAKVALARVGQVQLEFIEHLGGETIYRDFLKEHGEGLHHLQFLVDDANRGKEILAKEGHVCLQWAHFGDTGVYAYMDMKPLHSIWELVQLPEHRGVMPDHYPENPRPRMPSIKITGIDKVAMVVKDVQKTVESYWAIFGIGPWEIYLHKAPLVRDFAYHGKPSQAGAKVARSRVGALQLELIEPLYGDGVYQDHLRRHGEGLHHLSFFVEDVDETVRILASEGFPCLQSACLGDTGSYAYMDIKPLHTICELARPASDRDMEAILYPPESS